MATRWVLYREDSNTHEEIYFTRMRGGTPSYCLNAAEALGFPAARAAYDFATPTVPLQWWKVGLR